MDDIVEILEHELEDAVQVKNKDSLHRYVVLLAKNIVQKSAFDQNITEFRGDIRVLAETMKRGFETIDKRFEMIDKRFEAVDKRFEDMYTYMNKRFDAVDKRFEDIYKYMDKRFEDIDKRFTMMFTFMNIGFSILIIITIIFKFLQ
ncbi:MAG: hypothetical protein GWP06_04945 [Actinobacteria bacterium]|nr:hypothetical protein [Actinomycetota bacterium]